MGNDLNPSILGSVYLIRGKFFFREREFEITRAVLDFNTPEKINPFLHAQAKTKASEYEITINIEGNIKEQTITYSSFPFLEEPDIVSLLEIGVISKEINDFRMSVLQEAADILIVSQIQEPVENKIKSYIPIVKSIDLVPSYFAASQEVEPLFIINTELLPNVGLSYRAGLIQNNHEARLDYRVTNNFSLQANWKNFREEDESLSLQKSSEVGLDLIFTYEIK